MRSKWILGGFASFGALLGASMLAYTGGYAFWDETLSDLGKMETVAGPNIAGAIFFALSLTILAATLVAFGIKSKRFTRVCCVIAAAGAIVVAVCPKSLALGSSPLHWAGAIVLFPVMLGPMSASSKAHRSFRAVFAGYFAVCLAFAISAVTQPSIDGSLAGTPRVALQKLMLVVLIGWFFGACKAGEGAQ